jgi:hypothetical protein
VLGDPAGGVRIQDWFTSPIAQIETITTGQRTLSSGRVASLLQVMGTMTAPTSSIASLPAADQSRLQSALQQAWLP